MTDGERILARWRQCRRRAGMAFMPKARALWRLETMWAEEDLERHVREIGEPVEHGGWRATIGPDGRLRLLRIDPKEDFHGPGVDARGG